MDNLTYTYENSGKSNRLQRINDAGVKTVMTGVEHFVDGNTSNTDYLYDNSGNLKQDLNKGISSIVYNHLNKPTTITFSNGKKIQYIYDAAGSKLRQKVFGNGGSATTVETDYVGPFHYEDSDGDGSSATTAIQFFAHEEGRVRRAGSDLIYETFLKDHLGNVRVMFADMDGNGWVDPHPVNGEVLQVDHYYPFGLRMAGLSLVPAVKNSYLFTGKETQDELSLGWIDFGARMYDAAAGRWNGVDALGERYVSLSPYVYVANSPLMFVDPDGWSMNSIAGQREKKAKPLTEDNSGVLNIKLKTKIIDILSDANPGETYHSITGEKIHDDNIPDNKIYIGTQSDGSDRREIGEKQYIPDKTKETYQELKRAKFLAQYYKWKIGYISPYAYHDYAHYLLVWSQLVTDGAPLDLKNNTQSPLYSENFPIGYGFFNGRLLRFDDYGNMIYGASAKVYGLSLTFSRLGAGINQLGKGYDFSWFSPYTPIGIPLKRTQHPLGNPTTFFDTERDYYWIGYGYTNL